MKRVERICSHLMSNNGPAVPSRPSCAANSTSSFGKLDSKSNFGDRDFFDIHAHQMLRASAIIPSLVLGDPISNAKRIGVLFQQGKSRLPCQSPFELSCFCSAAANGAGVIAFPELSLCGYSIDDLHQQEVRAQMTPANDCALRYIQALLRSVLEAIAYLRDVTRFSTSLLLIGAPIRIHGRLLNCAIVLSHGRILGLNPKASARAAVLLNRSGVTRPTCQTIASSTSCGSSRPAATFSRRQSTFLDRKFQSVPRLLVFLV